jgi:predicted metal-dependent phosphoesterase TrpH
MEDPIQAQDPDYDDGETETWSDDNGEGGGDVGPTTTTRTARQPAAAVVVVDASSPARQQGQQQQPESRQEIAEQAAARAEVAVMEGPNTTNGRGTQRNTTADQALLGAINNDTVDAHNQVLDESGELVRQAFAEFLQN